MEGPGHVMRVENEEQLRAEEDSCMTVNRDDPESLNTFRSSVIFRKAMTQGFSHEDTFRFLRRSRSAPRQVHVHPLIIETLNGTVDRPLQRVTEIRETAGVISWQVSLENRTSEVAINARGNLVSCIDGIAIPRSIPEEYHAVFDITKTWGPAGHDVANTIMILCEASEGSFVPRIELIEKMKQSGLLKQAVHNTRLHIATIVRPDHLKTEGRRIFLLG